MDDINRFYESLYPPVGVRVLAVQGAHGIRQSFFDDNADLLDSAYANDGQGKTVYHACAVFQTTDSRKADNALAAKSLWVDLDVGPTKPYASAKDAATSIEQFRLAVGLEPPHLVRSGGGVHAYFAFTKAIAPEQWKRIASVMASCMGHFGVQYDSSRAEDIASVLRVPDTHNYKTDPPKQVKLVRLGGEEPVASIYKKLKDYADASGVLLQDKPRGPPKLIERTELMGVESSYPPSEGDIVAQHCAVIAEVEATGGDTSYEIWWRAMGVAKHTTTPDETAAKWTVNREATNHDKSDWQEVIDNWPTGPTTCVEFAKHSSKCGSCPHRNPDRLSQSPLSLGVPAIPVVAPTISPEQAQQAPIPQPPAEWSFGAQWLKDELAQRAKVGFSNGAMTYSELQDDGTYKHVSFCKRYWQVMRRVKTVGGVWALEIGYETYPGLPYETFMLESAFVTSPEKLKTEFSKHELHIHGKPQAMMKTQEIIRFEQDRLFTYRLETKTFPVMGWVTENNAPRGELTGSFVLGDDMFTPKMLPKKVLLDEAVPENLRCEFASKGSTPEWVEIIDRIYNRPGAEAYQFVIAAMFASPLVRLVPGAGEWHGIPVVLTGESGAAKTSTALAAMSVYTHPQLLKFNAGAKESQGDTITALARKIGTLSNIPFIADEATSLNEKELSGLLFMLANGMPRSRSMTTGKIVADPSRWDVISIATGNDNFIEKLRMLQNADARDAASLRCFEVPLRKSDLEDVFEGIHKTTFEVDLLNAQYGCVGRDWLQWVVNNRDKVSSLLGTTRASYQIEDDDKSAIRFYKDLLVTIEVGARLAARRGYIRWDVGQMMKWAKQQVVRLRDSVFEHNWDGTVSDFVSSLHGRTIVTKTMKLGPGRRSAKEMPLEPLTTATPPVARRAIDDKLFFVTATALSSWCVDNRVKESRMIGEMGARGYLMTRKGDKPIPRLINIGGGTPVTRPQAPCWELNFDALVNRCGSDRSDGASSNVLPFQTPGEEASAETVTKAVTTDSSGTPDVAVSP